MDNLIPLRQWAESLKITSRWARTLCKQGRVPGAVQMGDWSTAPWFVPADAVPELADSLKGPRPRWAEDKEPMKGPRPRWAKNKKPMETRDEFDDALLHVLRRFEEG